MNRPLTAALFGGLMLTVTALALADRGTGASGNTVSKENASRNVQAGPIRLGADPEQNRSRKGKKPSMGSDKLQFGNFSVSLAVKDLKASKAFYEKLDFVQVFGDMKQNYLIMQNGTTTVGLFQGMFEKNILTFNPGWNHKMETVDGFGDVRDLQATLEQRGIEPVQEADPESSGPASFVIVDPDGNTILVDQHVPRPE